MTLIHTILILNFISYFIFHFFILQIFSKLTKIYSHSREFQNIVFISIYNILTKYGDTENTRHRAPFFVNCSFKNFAIKIVILYIGQKTYIKIYLLENIATIQNCQILLFILL